MSIKGLFLESVRQTFEYTLFKSVLEYSIGDSWAGRKMGDLHNRHSVIAESGFLGSRARE